MFLTKPYFPKFPHYPLYLGYARLGICALKSAFRTGRCGVVRRQRVANVRGKEGEVVHSNEAGGGPNLHSKEPDAPVGVLPLLLLGPQLYLALVPAVRWQLVPPCRTGS